MNKLNSDLELLRKRGYIEEYDISEFKTLNKNELIEQLHDKDSVLRSVAAKVMRLKCNIGETELTNILLEQLAKEKKLYTRLEICTTLEHGDHNTAQAMIPYVGRIGKNQLRELPERPSLKISYPLPRDLIARSLGRMRKEIMPVLLDVLTGSEVTIIMEVLDAIGFLVFYNREAATADCLDLVIDTIHRYKNNDVIVWKGILCLSAFPFEKSIAILELFAQTGEKALFREEAKRAIRVMRK